MPDNSGYYLAAYAAAAIILGGYTVSLVVRTRALRARLRQSPRRGAAS